MIDFDNEDLIESRSKGIHELTVLALITLLVPPIATVRVYGSLRYSPCDV